MGHRWPKIHLYYTLENIGLRKIYMTNISIKIILYSNYIKIYFTDTVDNTLKCIEISTSSRPHSRRQTQRLGAVARRTTQTGTGSRPALFQQGHDLVAQEVAVEG